MFPLILALAVVQAVPVFVVAVRYDRADRTAWTRELSAIRALGFTAVVVPDDRVADIRPAAAEVELQVIARRDETTPPLVLLDGSGPPSALRYRGWTAIRHGARSIVFALDGGDAGSLSVRAAGAFAGTIAGSASLFLTMRATDGARPAAVDARLFQSGPALVLIALNHADEPREGVITLPPGTPLAEWVNLETGDVAYFDRAPDGVVHRHRFAARDALVLVIRNSGNLHPHPVSNSPCSKPSTSRSTTALSPPSATSASTCGPAGSSASSDRMDPASRPRSSS